MQGLTTIRGRAGQGEGLRVGVGGATGGGRKWGGGARAARPGGPASFQGPCLGHGPGLRVQSPLCSGFLLSGPGRTAPHSPSVLSRVGLSLCALPPVAS